MTNEELIHLSDMLKDESDDIYRRVTCKHDISDEWMEHYEKLYKLLTES